MIKNSILECIGSTPLIRLKNIELAYNLNFKLYAKVERFSASGSIKDRAALNMVNELIKEGKINKDTTIIEPTSGNMGISLAMIGAIKNIKVEIVMPENFSKERIKMIKSFNALVTLTKKEEGMQGSLNYALNKVKENKNYLMLSQFDNKYNYLAHLTTAKEIEDDLKDDLKMIVAGIGTGGTITGISEYFKNKDVSIIGVEPFSSPLLTLKKAGPHKIQGIGANFIPSILKIEGIKEISLVKDEEAYFYTSLLAKKEGIFVGISSGATLAGLLNIYKSYDLKNKSVVLIFPDNGERYLSVEGLYE